MTMSAEKLTTPFETYTGNEAAALQACSLTVRAFHPEADADKAPRSWREQDSVLTLYAYAGRAALAEDAAAVAFEQDVLTEAVGNHIAELIGHDGRIVKSRSKQAHSIFNKVHKRANGPKADMIVGDPHAFRVVTSVEEEHEPLRLAEELLSGTNTPAVLADGTQAVEAMGNEDSADEFSGLQTRLYLIVSDGKTERLVVAEVQLYTQQQYMTCVKTQRQYQENRGWGDQLRITDEVPAPQPIFAMARAGQMATAGLLYAEGASA